jgi:hypothetical protein
MQHATFGYSFRVDTLVVAVHKTGNPDPDLWEGYLQELRDRDPRAALVYWGDWAPDPQHRSDITLYAPSGIPVAVVSPRDSIWALAALDLFLTNVVQFRPEELNRAFQFVGVTDDRKKQVHLAMMEAGWPV